MKVEKSFFTATFDQFNAFFNFSKIILNSSVYKIHFIVNILTLDKKPIMYKKNDELFLSIHINACTIFEISAFK